MNKSILLIFALTLFFACNDEKDDPARSKTELLTGGNLKSWYLFSSTPEEPCSSAIDDSWIFFSNGSFEYNHGVVTEDETGECGDLVNIEGTWEFENNETTLTIIALREKGSTSNSTPLTLLQGEINVLDDGRLVVTATNPSTSAEFRKK